MRCQACDKNEATTTVICEGCKTHYASIREGQYRETELAHGEMTLGAAQRLPQHVVG